MKKVAVVILNWNGRKLLEQFLQNVISNSPQAEVIVADNASSDDSVEFLKKNFPALRIIPLPVNFGFAQGYNEALKQVDAEYFMLLNSDVEVTEGWLIPLVDFLNQHPETAACQPKIRSFRDRHLFEHAGAAGGFLDYLGYPFCRGRLFNTLEADNKQYDSVTNVFWATGACMLVRSEVFRKLNGFDERFFAHMEEIDLCWRLKNLGYKISYCAESTVYHVGGGTLHKSNPKKTYLNFRNNRKLLRKNLSIQELKTIYATRNRLDQLAALVALAKGNIEEAKAIRQGLNDYKNSLHKWDKKRSENEQLQKALSVGQTNKIGVLNESIIWNYFVKNIKKFSQLTFLFNYILFSTYNLYS